LDDIVTAERDKDYRMGLLAGATLWGLRRRQVLARSDRDDVGHDYFDVFRKLYP
jgi:hypothetical protein